MYDGCEQQNSGAAGVGANIRTTTITTFTPTIPIMTIMLCKLGEHSLCLTHLHIHTIAPDAELDDELAATAEPELEPVHVARWVMNSDVCGTIINYRVRIREGRGDQLFWNKRWLMVDTSCQTDTRDRRRQRFCTDPLIRPCIRCSLKG